MSAATDSELAALVDQIRASRQTLREMERGPMPETARDRLVEAVTKLDRMLEHVRFEIHKRKVDAGQEGGCFAADGFTKIGAKP